MSTTRKWKFDFAYALPETVFSAKKIAEMTNGDEAFIRDKCGIESRRFLTQDETPLDLAAMAAKAGLEKANISANELDWLIFVTQNPDFQLPQSSALLCHRIGAREDIASFDVSLGCSGWVYALNIANSFAQIQNLGTGMIVTCDPYSKAMNDDNKSVMSVFGDAAAATVMRPGGNAVIGKSVFGTDGKNGMELSKKAGGAHAPIKSIYDEQSKQYDPDDITIQMNGRAILDFMQTRIPPTVRNCIEINNLQVEEINQFVFHQASKYMLQLLTRRLQLPTDKVPIDVSDVGNTVSSSIPIVMSKLSDQGPMEGHFLVCGFGVGLSWASSILSFDS